jgi:folate-binding protein YgfZ
MNELLLAPVHRELGARFTSVWDHELPASFGAEPAAEEERLRAAVGLLDQSYRGIIDFGGKETAKFLEGIVSSHPSRLEMGASQASCLLTPKGRVLGAFQLYRLEGDLFRAVLAEPAREALLAALRKYAGLSDVEVREQSRELAIISAAGPRAPELLAAFGAPSLPPPARRLPWRLLDAEVSLAGGTSPESCELWIPLERLEALWRNLVATARDLGGGPVGWAAAEVLRLERGLPLFGIDYGEENFPAEVGWEHALTYDKCYIGQEVVARMRTYGHANRKLFRFTAGGASATPAAGARLLAGSVEAGRVTSAAFSRASRRPLGLAMAKRSFWEAEGLVVECGGATFPVRLEELPSSNQGSISREGNSP